MSKNALALVDCNNREQLYQFLVEAIDRKAVKNEMISPYDDQLIGKMNFTYAGLEHAMFFTYARSSEYPGMRFRNHKIIYLSLGVNEISSDILNRICARFGGFIDYDDDQDAGWQKKDRQKPMAEDKVERQEVKLVEENEDVDSQQEIRRILKLERKDEWQEDEKEIRCYEDKNEQRSDCRNTEKEKSERKENGKNDHRNKNIDKTIKTSKQETVVETENE